MDANSPSIKRPPPAFQEYASDMLANSQYRMMTLAEKGLFDILRRECWVNQQVPFASIELAAYLGIPLSEIEKNLTIRVLGFFKEKNCSLTCPELDSYKTMLLQRKEKIANGGRIGGKTTQARHKSFKGTLEGSLKALSREEISRDESNKDAKKSLGEGITKEEQDAWVSDYDASPECSASYLKASSGH